MLWHLFTDALFFNQISQYIQSSAASHWVGYSRWPGPWS